MEESEWTFWPTQYYHSALLTQFFWETNDIIKRKIVLYFKISIYRTKEKSRYKLSSEMLVISTVLIRVKCQFFNPLRRQNFYNFWKKFLCCSKNPFIQHMSAKHLLCRELELTFEHLCESPWHGKEFKAPGSAADIFFTWNSPENINSWWSSTARRIKKQEKMEKKVYKKKRSDEGKSV